MGRVYAVASGKGGVGKTTTTAALGATLAAAGESVVVVDADLGMANLGGALGVDDDPPTLHEVLAGGATVADATREGPAGLAVVPGSRDLDAFADARPEGMAEVVGTLADTYEFVLVDTGAGLSNDSLSPLRTADEVLLVSTPDRDALRNTAKTAEVCRRLETPVRGLVLVRADADAAGRVRSSADHEVLGTVPDDPAVTAALEAATAVTEHAPGSPAAAAYRDLARTLADVDVPDPAGEASGNAGAALDPTAAGGTGDEDGGQEGGDGGSEDDVDASDEDEDAGDSGEDDDADETGDGEVRFEDPVDADDAAGTDPHPAAAGGDEAAADGEDADEAAADGEDDDGDEADGGGEDDDGGKGLFSRLFG